MSNNLPLSSQIRFARSVDGRDSNNVQTTVRTLLLDTARIIRANGWTQGTSVDLQGRLCIVGALGQAAINQPTSLRLAALRRIADAIHVDPADWLNISKWNDEGDRTVDDVLRALERAACSA